ncbi:MAG: phosphoglycerate dehydrogenase [Gammaproteobacteria bacterium]|nr:phosphoglycerate dehydrogenase [Gammaproteobacteria bacterium]
MNKREALVAVTSRSFSKNFSLVEELKKHYSNVLLNHTGKTLKDEELIEFLKKADKAIIGIEKITDSLLSQLPNLKVISKYGVGLNNIDLDLLKNHNVRLGFTPGVNKQSVAELALALILTGLKKIQENNIDILNGNWSQERGSELYGKTIGIIGFGNIGQKLASLIQPFNCNILFFDERNFLKEDLKLLANDLNLNLDLVTQSSLRSILLKSNILSIHLPLTQKTKDLISLEEFSELKSDVCIVNTARGGIVNENDLHEFLNNNPGAYAGFDVFKEEPAFNNPLLKLPNFFGTSHRSSLTNEGIYSMGIAAINGLDDNIEIT